MNKLPPKDSLKYQCNLSTCKRWIFLDRTTNSLGALRFIFTAPCIDDGAYLAPIFLQLLSATSLLYICHTFNNCLCTVHCISYCFFDRIASGFINKHPFLRVEMWVSSVCFSQPMKDITNSPVADIGFFGRDFLRVSLSYTAHRRGNRIE